MGPLRKIIPLLLAAAAALMTCACGGSAPAETTSGQSGTEDTLYSAPQNTVPAGYSFVMKLPFAEKYIPDDSAAGARLAGIYADAERATGAVITVELSAGAQEYISAVASGGKYADVVGLGMRDIYVLARMKYLRSTDDPTLVKAGFNINDRTRFYAGISGLVTWADRQWSFQIPSEYDHPIPGSFVLYNYGITSSVGAGNLRNLAETGKWTWKQYLALSNASAVSAGDERIYGTGAADLLGVALSCGGSLLDESGGIWAVSTGEHDVLLGINWLSRIRMPENNALRAAGTEELFQSFIEGRLEFLIINGGILEDNPLLLTASGGVGVLPMPKNLESEGYVSLVSAYNGMGFLSSGTDASASVAVLNVLAAALCDAEWPSLYTKSVGMFGGNGEIMRNIVLQSVAVSKTEYDLRLSNAVNDALKLTQDRSNSAVGIARQMGEMLENILPKAR